MKSSLQQDPIPEESIKEDMKIIDSSLHFINDLLRSMLDVHRAANKQMKLDLSHTDLLHDIFEPVVSMLYNRDEAFKVEIECPERLIVETDRLRLQQIVLK